MGMLQCIARRPWLSLSLVTTPRRRASGIATAEEILIVAADQAPLRLQ
jgi:hypothetical protein